MASRPQRRICGSSASRPSRAFKQAPAAEVAEQGEERMDAVAAAAEKAREAREEAAANGPLKRAAGRLRKALGAVPTPPPDRGASKPKANW
jgi:hypothetical protein